MFKLLANYIREQKTSLVQVFGLGFVIIIMVSSFLSLNFATNYVNDQYQNDIAEGQFHQEIEFNLSSNFKTGSIRDSWLNNLNYINLDSSVNKEKMIRATFQVRKLPEYNEENNLYFYRFYFENSIDNIHVGENFAFETGHNYVDFKLSIPLSYPTFATHNQFLKTQANIINNYVYNPDDASTFSNKTNFFITNNSALNFYNKNIKNNLLYPFAKRSYEKVDINNQARLYQLLIMGMLYGDNLSWTRVLSINDLLITGKIFSFIQSTPENKVNSAIIVDDDDVNINPQNLNDDEILIYREFAKENNLKIGQDYIFSGYNFKIVGYATSALAANNATYFSWKSDNKNQTIAFANQNTIEKIKNNPYTLVYQDEFMAFDPENGSRNISEKINNSWVYQYFHQKLLTNKTINKEMLYSAINNAIDNRFLLNPLTIRSIYKFQAIETIVWRNINQLKDIFLEIASTFLGLIFVVVSVIIFIVIFKMIDRNKRLIGILKAHGYPNWKLNFSLVISTVFPVILFSILGSSLAIVFGHFIVNTYSTALILINYGWPFYYQTALLIIFVPFIILSIISFIMVAFLLKINTLTLINNSWEKNKYNLNINAFFASLLSKITKNFNYYNKLAITTTFRGFGKTFFVIIVTIFASTLLLFSFSSSVLINNLLGLQFASINYDFNTKYDFNSKISNNFINADNKLLYKKENVNDIKTNPSLYLPIREAIIEMINDSSSPKLIDFRYGYIMGSELYKIRKEIIEQNFTKFPVDFQEFWKQNIYFIDYLTNDNGKKETDLMVNFGLLAYNSLFESSYTEFNFIDAHDFNINTIDTNCYYYDNDNDILQGDWLKLKGNSRTAYAVNEANINYLSPGLKNTNFKDFTNLTLEEMNNNGGWINNNFLNIRNTIINKFNIQNPDSASVKIIPMIGSVIPGIKNTAAGDGNNLGKTVLYRYRGLDSRNKYIIGVVYDGAKNLLQNTILMPESWLNSAVFGDYHNLAIQFSNSKFTKFANSELYQFFPIISSTNDYLIDLSKITNSNYLKEKGIVPGLSMIYDVNAIKDMFQARQYSLQTIILLFGIFSVVLSFMIIIIISNINIRDNLVLINILRSLGYSVVEISYIFLLTTIPILIVFSLFSVLIAPIFTEVVANSISNFLLLNVPIIFKWWFFALTLLIILLIYFVSYVITWSLNVNNKKLMDLTK